MSHGILGINARNLLFIRPYNSKKAIRLADDKLKTKYFLSARGIPVPRLYAQIRSKEELKRFDFVLLPDSFVLKPNSGYGGEGIIPIQNRDEDAFISTVGEAFSTDQLKSHIEDILDGRFSLSNAPDIAFFEQRIIPDESIGKYSYKGLPDIRIVVYNLIPVMAMLRLPTERSRGRANLHQGAVGVGIDIARGEATYIAQGSQIIDQIPGIGGIRKLKIPHWDEMLLIASKVQLITNLGYVAVDLVLDKNTGPLLLEINARAGLSVQIANLAPLRRRLDRIQGLKVGTPEKGVRLAKDMFGEQIERGIKHMSGKQVVGIEEDCEIILSAGTYKVLARIDTGIDYTVLDGDFAHKIGLSLNEDQKRLKLKYSLKGFRIQTAVEIKPVESGYKMEIGRRDLAGFLVDPSHRSFLSLSDGVFSKPSTNKPDFSEIDRIVVDADRQIKLLYHLKPKNLNQEVKKFLKDLSYNPQFVYPGLKFDPDAIKNTLGRLVFDESVLAQIYRLKIQEIFKKIDLLQARSTIHFEKRSRDLFGFPSEQDLISAQLRLKNYDAEPVYQGSHYFTAEEAALTFEQVFKRYGLTHWKVKFKKSMITNIMAGKDNVLFVNQQARFSKKRIASLIVHEIETHILTAENGKKQPYSLFNRGTAYYLKSQEGLAVYNQEKRIGVHNLSAFSVALSVLAVLKAATSSFAEVYSFLKSFGVSQERALKISLKVKRGLSDTSQLGAFTKDWLYFKGSQEIRQFVEGGGDLKRLYIGKISLDDLEIIEQIPGLVDPVYLPWWLK